jgi:hypothetical protein
MTNEVRDRKVTSSRSRLTDLRAHYFDALARPFFGLSTFLILFIDPHPLCDRTQRRSRHGQAVLLLQQQAWAAPPPFQLTRT